VPKLARKYVKPEDICFSDITEYHPSLLKRPPYRLPITSTVPLLGDKVDFMGDLLGDPLDLSILAYSICTVSAAAPSSELQRQFLAHRRFNLYRNFVKLLVARSLVRARQKRYAKVFPHHHC
jgi:hypothetical protein